MVQEFYSWIRNITCYLIFVMAVVNLLPSKKYEQYLKFFFGMVFVLLVIQPFTRGLRVEDRIAYYFQTFSLQNDAEDLKKEILGVEGVRLEQMLNRYEEAVTADVSQMAQTAGFTVRKAAVKLGRIQDSESFGKVISIYLMLTLESGDAVLVLPVEPVADVSPVVVGDGEEPLQEPAQQTRSQDENVLELRKKLLSYYDLEEQYVEIQLQNNQRQVDHAADRGSDPDDSGRSDGEYGESVSAES